MAEKIISIPGAKRTTSALKDLGYDLNSAVADILDNSISRGEAKNIFIDFKKDENEKFRLIIADDGRGMNSDTLEEAMRIGSSNDDYSNGDLSKYGMGMKTASMSQSLMITVLSKMVGEPETAFNWDLNHVYQTNKWEIFKLEQSEIQIKKSNIRKNDYNYINNLLIGESWTVLLWEDLREFEENYNSYKSIVTAENYFYRVIDGLKTYLGLVFHRFLAGENSASKTNIFINSTKIKPIDPFCRNELHTIELELSEKNGNFVIREENNPIVIKRYILPTNPKKEGEFKFSSIEAWEEASGTKSWNDSQGYYVYRNNRLISWGGWFKTKNKDEHDKLARASIDLLSEHDDLFTLDVKKTKIQFPEELKNHLRDNINSKFISEAKRRYAGSEKKKSDIINVVRENPKKVSHLAAELVKSDNISVVEGNTSNQLIIKNQYGLKISEDMGYKMLDAGKKIISKPFGDATLLWKMIPNPNNEFQVIVNSDHPFYNIVYGDAEKDKKITAIMDAFLFTMSFIELKCITNNNELLFDQMKEVASSVLNKFIDEKIL